MKIPIILNNFKKTLEKNEISKIKKILFLLFVSLILETLSISSLIPLISFIAAPDLLLLKVKQFNIFNGEVSNFLINEDKSTVLLYLSFFTVLIFGIKNFSIILINRYKERFFAKLNVNLSSRIYSSYLNSNYRFFLKNNSARIIRNLVSEVPNIINLLNLIFLIIIDLGLILTLSGLIIFLNFKIYLIVMCFLLLFGILYVKYFKSVITLAGQKRQLFQGKYIKTVNETFSLFNYIKIEKLSSFFESIFTNLAIKFNEANLKRQIILLYSRNILEFCLIIFLVISLLYLLNLYQDFDKVQLFLAIILLIIIRLSPSFLRIINSINNIRFVSVSLSEVNKIKILLRDNNPKKNNDHNFKLKNIKFQKVKFKFDGDKKYIFENLKLNLSANDKICIIGETGSGKSTFLNLLLGLMKPSSGNILINGRKIELYKLNNIISYVPQKIILFESTIKKNILFNKTDQHINLKQFQKCIDDANLRSFINSKKNKENFLLLEDGKNISVGQKQRIGIARAICGKAEVLVLDEATSSLDIKNENIVYKNLMQRFKNKMIVCVTHRLSNLKYFDKVFKVEQGKLIKIK
jgi:ABC-type bacteriocin/lantibiotic exporter with double-glycine peptidase domain